MLTMGNLISLLNTKYSGCLRVVGALVSYCRKSCFIHLKDVKVKILNKSENIREALGNPLKGTNVEILTKIREPQG